jgi:hypothetical protein
MMVTGRRDNPNQQREVEASPDRLFGRKNGSVPPPPYTVQVQVQRRNPLRQQAQNELFMQAYSMSAQAGQIFPLSVLFELLHVDGKERILPVLKQNEAFQQQMQQLAVQNEQLQVQVQQQAEEIANLEAVNAQYVVDEEEPPETLPTIPPEGAMI